MGSRERSSWCRRGDHLGCGEVRAVCDCSCHGATVDAAVERARPGPKPGTVDRAKAGEVSRAAWVARAQQPSGRALTAKEDAPCCVKRRDGLGRLPIGFCSPRCVRRPPKAKR